MKFFQVTEPMEFVAVDILVEQIRTPFDHKYIILVTLRLTKLGKAIPIKGMSAVEVSKLFIDHLVFNYGPSTTLLSDNGSQFTSQFFEDVCRILNTNNIGN